MSLRMPMPGPVSIPGLPIKALAIVSHSHQELLPLKLSETSTRLHCE